MPVSIVLYILLSMVLLLATLMTIGKYRRFEMLDKGICVMPKMSRLTRFTLLSIFILGVFICCIKPESLPDARMYRLMLQSIQLQREGIEYSFTIIRKFSPSVIVLFGIYAILSIGAKIYAIEKLAPCLWMSMFTYFASQFVLHDMIQIRNAVASGLCLYSIKYIYNRDYVHYFVIMAIAVFFHYSALCFLPMILLRPHHFNKKVYSVILPVAVILGVLGLYMGSMIGHVSNDLVVAYLEEYQHNKNFEAKSIGPMWVARATLAMICVFRIKELQKRYPYGIIVLKIYIIGLVCFPLFMDIPVMAGRISEFYNVVQIFALPMVPLAFKKRRLLVQGAVLCLVCAIWYQTYNSLIAINI